MSTYLGDKIAQSILSDRTPDSHTGKNPFAAIPSPALPWASTTAARGSCH
jgi:hypothetical protein